VKGLHSPDIAPCGFSLQCYLNDKVYRTNSQTEIELWENMQLPRRPVFVPRSRQVGFVVDKVALGQILSEYFGFPRQFSFYQLIHTYHHLPSGAGTTSQRADPVSPQTCSCKSPEYPENVYSVRARMCLDGADSVSEMMGNILSLSCNTLSRFWVWRIRRGLDWMIGFVAHALYNHSQSQ
jgi:hypothetical protein